MSMCHRPLSLSHVTRSIAFIEGVEVFVEKRTRCKRVFKTFHVLEENVVDGGVLHIYERLSTV